MKIPFVDLKAQYRSIRAEIDRAIREVLEESAFILGPRLEAFEREFAAYCGAPHCAGVGSGTDALYLALKACGVGPGDEVITVSHTFIATAEAISFAGARPVFIDVDPSTQLMDPEKIAGAVTSKTKAIVPVHLFGQVCDMDAIFAAARKHKLRVIEDCCQAHGATLGDARAPVGEMGCFSFYPGKNLGAYGDGGAVVSRDKNIHDYVVRQRDHGRPPGVKYEHPELGFGFRLDTLQAAILGVKLKHLEQWTEKRRANARQYDRRLKDAVGTPVEARGRRHVYHLYPIRSEKRDGLKDHLEKAGVSAIIHYPVPVHLQPAYASLGGKKGDLPVTERCCRELLSLPIYPELTPEEIDYVCDRVLEFLKK